MSSPKKNWQKDRDKKREDLERKRKAAAKQGGLNPNEGGEESLPLSDQEDESESPPTGKEPEKGKNQDTHPNHDGGEAPITRADLDTYNDLINQKIDEFQANIVKQIVQLSPPRPRTQRKH